MACEKEEIDARIFIRSMHQQVSYKSLDIQEAANTFLQLLGSEIDYIKHFFVEISAFHQKRVEEIE